MTRFLVLASIVLGTALVVSVAVAQMVGPAAQPGAMGPGMMGPGMMGSMMMGAGGCPGAAPEATVAPLTEEKAKVAAQAYADKYLKGFAVDKVLPFNGMHGSMYSVELKGPNEEMRVLHVNPWGTVMPFGGPWRRTG